MIFNRISILGLGLIGGSLGLEVKKQKLAKTVVAYNRSSTRRELALKRKACDQAFSSPKKAVMDADLVVLATPVQHIPELAKKIASHLKPGAIVTDVGSTKQVLLQKLKTILPKDIILIGGHPIAGTENSGMESAQLDLFLDHWWILTPTGKSKEDNAALKKLRALVKSLGAKVEKFSAKDHDHYLAAISHLPHMIAYALVDATIRLRKGRPLRFAGGGFKDFTRIAASSSEMWADICLDNPQEILNMMERFEKSLIRLKQLIIQSDQDGLKHYFETAAQVKRKMA